MQLNQFACITLKIMDATDNPSIKLQEYIGWYLHFPIAKLNGVDVEKVLKVLHLIGAINTYLIF